MEEFDRNWKTFSERSPCCFFWFSDLSHLLNARRRDWKVNSIFGKEEFGECSFCWICVSGTRWRKLRQDFFQRKVDLFVCPKKIEKITHFDGGSLDHCFRSNMFDFGLILYQFIFASCFLVRPSWCSDKSTRKSSPFFEFSGIIA